MSNKKWPHIKIETIDKDRPPVPGNWRVYLNGEDISTVVSRAIIDIGVDGVSSATITFIANVDVDGAALVNEQ